VFPEVLSDWIRPTRQEVHYFEVPKGSTRYLPGQLPIWIDFGKRIVYGIPAVDGHSFKVADDTRGDRVDAPNENPTPSPEALARARSFLAERFPELAKAPLVASEVCNYENSPDGNLIIDRHPLASNVWFIGGGSGHGFKLSPAVGEMAAAQILLAKDAPSMFRLQRLRDTAKPKTQFEKKQSS
jgi:glycine/D-amino acid oxidase-like deaminating enzyme